MDIQVGTLFVRNVETLGYQAAIREQGKVTVPVLKVEEYVNGPVLSLREGQVKKSLNLPVEESPVIAWETDFSKWASVDAFAARAMAGPMIQPPSSLG